jgi:hypothetical protein
MTPEGFARYVFAQLVNASIIERVEIVSDDSARVTLKTGQTFVVAVVHGRTKAKRSTGA